MPRFRVLIPHGVVQLKDVQTGRVLTLTADDGPLDLGVMAFSWLPDAESEPHHTPSDPDPEPKTAHAPTPGVDKPEAPKATARPKLELPSQIPSEIDESGSVKIYHFRTTESPKPDPVDYVTIPAFFPLLDAPIEALTEANFTLYLEGKAKDRGKWYWDEESEATYRAVEARFEAWKHYQATKRKCANPHP